MLLIKKISHNPLLSQSLSQNFGNTGWEPVHELSYYKDKRIYRDKTKSNLLNQIMINELIRHEIFVRNSLKMYNLSKKCLGNHINIILRLIKFLNY